jgi:hypothetical protein
MFENFNSISIQAFSEVCREFYLFPVEIDEGRIALVARDYLLLIWGDRDGSSVKYVPISDVDRELKFTDICFYLITKRSWVSLDFGDEVKDDYDSRVYRELVTAAHAIKEFASDILRGDKKWISNSSVSFMPLSGMLQEQIREIIKMNPRNSGGHPQ